MDVSVTLTTKQFDCIYHGIGLLICNLYMKMAHFYILSKYFKCEKLFKSP